MPVNFDDLLLAYEFVSFEDYIEHRAWGCWTFALFPAIISITFD